LPALTEEQRSAFERWWAVQEKVDVPYPSDGPTPSGSSFLT